MPRAMIKECFNIGTSTCDNNHWHHVGVSLTLQHMCKIATVRYDYEGKQKHVRGFQSRRTAGVWEAQLNVLFIKFKDDL